MERMRLYPETSDSLLGDTDHQGGRHGQDEGVR